MTVNELLQRISSRELSEWFEFSKLEPFGDARADFRTGILASVIANAFRDSKTQKEPFSPADFMIDYDEFAEKTQPETTEEKPMSPAHILAIVEVLNTAFGGKDLRTPEQKRALEDALNSEKKTE